MAPVIWGLDLAEIKWSKFKGSYMWNNEWHLRRTKFIVYQLAMITTVVSESLGTDALSGKLNVPGIPKLYRPLRSRLGGHRNAPILTRFAIIDRLGKIWLE